MIETSERPEGAQPEPPPGPVADEVVVDDPDGFGRTGLPGERAEIGKPLVRPARLAVVIALFTLLAVSRGLPAMVMVVAIIVVIFFHELGHFVMARRAGMKVTEFMIGFGPRIFSFRRGEVEYGLKAIPAGAYVKIIGMANVEEVPPDDESRTYRQKGYWARMGVAVAGSTMHFIMAILLVVASFVFVGQTDAKDWVVNTIAPDSAAQVAGIRAGDKVVSVDGVAVQTHSEMAKAAQQRPGETIPIVVERDGKDLTLTSTITPRFLVYGTVGEDMQIYETAEGDQAVSLSSSSTLTDDGLRDGDVIRSINGTTVDSIDSVRKLLLSPAIADTGAFEATVVHEGESGTDQVSIDLGTKLNAEAPKGFFGVGQDLVPDKLNVLEAVPASLRWFGETAKQTVSGMVSFFSLSSLSNFAQRTFSTTPGESRVSDTAQTAQAGAEASQERDGKRIVSIVGVVLLGGDLTASGWGNLLMFLAFLNMALGIFNLAPLPPFDGGHVVIGTYEKIRELLRRDGKRYFADANKLMPVALAVISFTLIIGLMAIYLDLADPIRV